MGNQAEREKFLNNCAKTIMGQLKLDGAPYHQTIYSSAADIYKHLPPSWKARIVSYINDQSDGYLGRLVSASPSARVQMAYLAAEQVMRTIAARIWHERKRIEAEAAKAKPASGLLKCKFCSFTVAALTDDEDHPNRSYDPLWDHLQEEHPVEARRVLNYAYSD